jgi:hypothetical protein
VNIQWTLGVHSVNFQGTSRGHSINTHWSLHTIPLNKPTLSKQLSGSAGLGRSGSTGPGQRGSGGSGTTPPWGCGVAVERGSEHPHTGLSQPTHPPTRNQQANTTLWLSDFDVAKMPKRFLLFPESGCLSPKVVECSLKVVECSQNPFLETRYPFPYHPSRR